MEQIGTFQIKFQKDINIFINMGFGKERKRLRSESKISAQALADLIGIEPERLRKWESRDLNPRYEDQVKIEAFFGMDIKDVQSLGSIKKFLTVPTSRPEPLANPYSANESTVQEGSENYGEKNISQLIESAKLLSESCKLMAETNEAVTKELLHLINERRKVTKDEISGIPKAVLQKMAKILTFVAKAGTGGWKDENQALTEMHTSFYDMLPEALQAGKSGKTRKNDNS